MKKVMVIGSGAREHTIAKTFLKSSKVQEVVVVPGNPGMVAPGITTKALDTNDFASLIKFAQDEAISLTFVGNEVPLVAGIVDAFNNAHLAIFGPKQQAAQLEGSKAFMKRILTENEIPTAKSITVTSLAAAQQAVTEIGYPVVVKTDELAAGKGVSIHQEKIETSEFLEFLYQKNPNHKLIIEEYLAGFEFSLFSFVGKNQIVNAPLAHDYKRRFAGDKGPNTGGMGSYSPVAQVSDTDLSRTISELVLPTIAALKKEKIDYEGVLYTGVMLTKNGPKVIEYNVRLGDPETQVVLPQLESDFYDLITGLLLGKAVKPKWQTENKFVGVVLSDPDYPIKTSGQHELPKFKEQLDVDIASCEIEAGNLYSHGGRVLTVVNAGTTMEIARDLIYHELDRINTKLAYRSDIAELSDKKEAID